jgi:hypothetical protein
MKYVGIRIKVDLKRGRVMNTEIPQAPVPQTTAQNVDSSIRLAEYTALRADILKEVEIQNRLITFTIAIAGAIITISLSTPTNLPKTLSSTVLFIYPLVGMIFAAGWVQSNGKINRINTYIRKTLMSYLQDLGWEEYLYNEYTSKGLKSFKLFNVLYIYGVFGGSQLLTIILGLFLINSINLTMIVSMIVGVGSLIATISLLFYFQKFVGNF